MKSQKINIFWTGGYDSTYRIAQLSKFDVVIQPFYIKDNRKREPNELNAIECITREILRHPETRCTFLPLKTFNRSDVPEDTDITHAWENIRKNIKLGRQYNWIARYVKFFGDKERFECSIETKRPCTESAWV